MLLRPHSERPRQLFFFEAPYEPARSLPRASIAPARPREPRRTTLPAHWRRPPADTGESRQSPSRKEDLAVQVNLRSLRWKAIRWGLFLRYPPRSNTTFLPDRPE